MVCNLERFAFLLVYGHNAKSMGRLGSFIEIEKLIVVPKRIILDTENPYMHVKIAYK